MGFILDLEGGHCLSFVKVGNQDQWKGVVQAKVPK